MKERDLIRWIRDRTPPAPGVPTGIGDDAAVLAGPRGDLLVVTTDLLVEGTHFRAGDAPEAVGRKALAVSISDVAAMGCRPVAAVLAVALRAEQSEEYARRLLEGVSAVAAEYEVPLVGGDTTSTTGPAVLASTLIGRPPDGGEPILRRGARPGEVVLVTGSLGGSLAGRHLVFAPRLREALELVARERPGAMIDLSDGLSTDARHVAEESGVVLVIDADRVPVAAEADDRSALDHALNDGEDFELLFTLPADAADRVVASGLAGTAVHRVGEVRAGSPGVLLRHPDGREEELPAGGYEHFA